MVGSSIRFNSTVSYMLSPFIKNSWRLGDGFAWSTWLLLNAWCTIVYFMHIIHMSYKLIRIVKSRIYRFYVWLLTPCQCMLTSVLAALWFYVWLLTPCQCMLTSIICSYIICLCIICLCKYEELYTICDIVIYQSSTIGACDLMTCYIHPVYVYETRISSHSEFLHIQNRYGFDKSFNNNTVNKQQQLL